MEYLHEYLLSYLNRICNCQCDDEWFLLIVGIKATQRMQQLQDFNSVCYEKVITQVKNGHQVRSEALCCYSLIGQAL